ncbi:hypothetical protein PM082_022322 [Marasmius tenuissimus]|nr:hypothetical protein PM082_022322 [Marasmius tenuissimus]
MAPLLLRNPNPEVAVMIGRDAEEREARQAAEKAYEWAKEENILKEGVTAEEFLQPARKKLCKEPAGVERAARGEMTAKLKSWQEWGAKWNQKGPEEASWVASRPLAPGEWVRVRGGTYHGDEGMIHDENRFVDGSPKDCQYTVLLVPRLAPAHAVGIRSNKRKRPFSERWTPRPFDPTEYKVRRGGTSLPKSDQDVLFKYNNMTFSHGLLVKVYTGNSLVPVERISQPLTHIFRKHPFCRNFPFPLPALWQFEFGEEVFFSTDQGEDSTLYGISPGSKGILCDQVDDQFLVDFGKGADGEDDIQPVPERFLRKVVAPGDYVRVLSGPFQGREGSVVEKHGATLAILEKNDASSKCFLVQRNCVRREKPSFYKPPSVPWLGEEVRIEFGRHAGQFGIIKDAQLGPYGDCFMLSLYIPALDCSAKAEDNNVFLKGTQCRLWERFPSDKKEWQIDSRTRRLRSGQVPWTRVRVAVTHGQNKGYVGTVRDVNRTTKIGAKSGLELDIELDVVRVGSSMPTVKIYYDSVRELRSGKTLNDFRPVSQDQMFFAPNPDFKGDRKRLRQHVLPTITLDTSENPLTWAPAGSAEFEEYLRREHSRLEQKTSSAPEDPLATPPPEDNLALESPRAGTPQPDLHWGPMDVWNPGYEQYWEIVSGPVPASPRSMSPAPSPQRCSTSAVASRSTASSSSNVASSSVATPSHWIAHEKLSRLEILVDITEGARRTLNKKREGTHVTPVLPFGQGTPMVREQRKASSFDAPVTCVARFHRRPNENCLMVVIPQKDPHMHEHFGKLVRFVSSFYDGPKVAVYRRWICAVVGGTDASSKLTGEIVVFGTQDLEAVKQSKEVSEWAKTSLMAPVREYMKSRDTECNTKGEGSYEDLTAMILGQMLIL